MKIVPNVNSVSACLAEVEAGLSGQREAEDAAAMAWGLVR